MFTRILKVAGLLTMLFFVPMVVLHAQPYDDHDLRALLTPPDDCAAPCFMGIRPGVTTAEEAIKILEGQGSVVNTIEPYLPYGIRFRVNHPHSLIDGAVSSYLSLKNDQVDWLRIPTNISLGDLWAVYGQPQLGFWSFRGGTNPDIVYVIGYNQDLVSLGLSLPMECWSGNVKYLLPKKVALLVGKNMKENADIFPTLWLFSCDELLS